MKRPRCFIALAFGKKDTDVIYDKHIKPIVKECGFSPRRVDRVVHNDYIDRKIIEEIENAQICIADLTYARQSVYFEAGYALRKIPVLYTCRKDHFKNSKDDERIHFDVRQRHIVEWKNVKDSSFSTRLKIRLNHLAKPILREHAQNQKLELERVSFGRLSVKERLNRIDHALETFLKRLMFERKKYKPTFFSGNRLIHPDFLSSYSLYFKKKKKELTIINDLPVESLPVQLINKDLIPFEEYHVEDALSADFLKGIELIRNVNLIVSIHSINKNTITRHLSSYSQPINNYYKIDSPRTVKTKDRRQIPLTSEFVFSDKVKSVSDMHANINQLFNQIQISR
jgi:nucleoside 2-deoxyribosyltransferase